VLNLAATSQIVDVRLHGIFCSTSACLCSPRHIFTKGHYNCCQIHPFRSGTTNDLLQASDARLNIALHRFHGSFVLLCLAATSQVVDVGLHDIFCSTSACLCSPRHIFTKGHDNCCQIHPFRSGTNDLLQAFDARLNIAPHRFNGSFVLLYLAATSQVVDVRLHGIFCSTSACLCSPRHIFTKGHDNCCQIHPFRSGTNDLL